MKITCPHCSYTREMAEERIPDGTLTARCPQCGERFQFSKEALREGIDEGSRAVRLGGREDAAKDRDLERPAARDAARAEQPGAPWEGSDGLRHHRGFENGQDAAGASWQAQRGEAKDGRHARGEDVPQGGRSCERQQDGQQDGRQDGSDDGTYDRPYGNAYDDVHDESGLSFNPWECAGNLPEYVSAFFQTCLRVMFAPGRFFAGISPRSGLLALSFFLAVCFFQSVVEHIWGVVFFNWVMPLTETTDPQIKELGELIAGQYNFSFLLLRCVMLTVQLYVFAFILHFCWRIILRGRADFTVVLQVLCYSQGPLVLCIIPGVGTLVGMIWCLVCALIGCRAALRITWSQTVMGMMPLFILLVLSYAKFFSILS